MNLRTVNILTILLITGQLSIAQERVPALDKAAWFPAPAKDLSFQRAGYWGFSQQQQLQMRANMARVMEQIHQTPVLNPPRGFSAGTYASLCEDGCSGKLIAGESGVIFLEYYRKGNNPKVLVDEEGPSIKVYFNNIGKIVDLIGTDENAYFEEPYITDTVQGFPVYRNSLVAITKSKEPLFVPLSQERYLLIEIEREKKLVEDLKKTAAQGSPYQQWIKNKEANIKAMMEGLDMLAKTDPAKAKAEREKFLRGMQQQDSIAKADEAKFLRDQQGMIDKATTAVKEKQQQLASYTAEQKIMPMLAYSGRPYMQCNPAFFNTKLAPYAIQLILVDLFKYHSGNGVVSTLSKRDKQLFQEIRDTIDLRKLLAVLQ